MRINQNISAMNTYSRLTNANNAKAGSLAKLSSGLRINRAGDDAAGLAISEKMRGQVGGLKQSVRNAQDGISLIQTAEGGLNETHSILNRMRELAVQSSNDTNTLDDRKEIQKEMDQLSKEITRISADTQFNTKELLDGGFEATFHIGANEGQNLKLNIEDMSASALGVEGTNGFEKELNAIITPESDLTVIAGKIAIPVGTSVNEVVETTLTATELNETVTIGGNNYNYALKNDAGEVFALSTDGKSYDVLKAKVTEEKNLSASTDMSATKIGFGTAVVKSGNVTVTATMDGSTATTLDSLTAKADKAIVQLAEGAELKSGEYTVVADTHGSVPSGSRGLLDSKGEIVGLSSDSGITWKSYSDSTKSLFTMSSGNGLAVEEKIKLGSEGGIDVSTQTAADKAISTIDEAIGKVSAERSKLGATQNRLDHTINNLTATAENLSEAESRIRDVDMAEEMMQFTKNNILSQAATSMLAQANQMPQSVLQLLQ